MFTAFSRFLDWLLGPRIPAELLVRLPYEFHKYKRLKGKNMDPITAIFNFLSTPEGQKVVAGIETIIQDLVKLFHQNSAAAATPAVVVVPVKPNA